MACQPSILKQVPLFALLDDDETAVLAAQVEIQTFAPRQRIYRLGDQRRPRLCHGVRQRQSLDDRR